MDSERNFMKDLRHNVGTADVLAKADWFKNLPTAAKISIGIAGDIAADPLTYLTGSGALEAAGGASGLSEKLANAAVDFKRVGDTANEARAVEIGGNLLRKGKGGIGALATLLVVVGTLDIIDAANAVRLTPDALVAEAEAWAIAEQS